MDTFQTNIGKTKVLCG